MPDSSEMRLLSREGKWPSLSPRGDRVVFGLRGRLAVLPVDDPGAAPEFLTPEMNANRPCWSWSPRIVFSDLSRLYTVAADGGPCQPYLPQLAEDAPNLIHPCWYKDLRSVAALGMVGRRGTRGRVVYRLTPGAPDGEAFRPLTRFPEVCPGRLSVSPDGGSIVFAGNAGGFDQEVNQLWVLTPPDPPRRLEPGEPRSAYSGRAPSWSPDGRWIAFTSARPDSDLDRSSPKSIWVIAAAGGPAHRLTDSRYNPLLVEWSRDQRQLVFGSFTHGIGVLDVPEAFGGGAGGR